MTLPTKVCQNCIFMLLTAKCKPYDEKNGKMFASLK